MEFLSEYYLWFIIGGIILVMAIIGYIADKTDFGRKNKSADTNNKLKEETKEKINTDSEVIETPVVEAVEENNLNDSGVDIDLGSNEFDASVVIEPSIDLNDTIVEEQINDTIVEDEIVEQSSMNDINASLENNDKETNKIKEVIDDSAYVLNNDLSSFAAGSIDLNTDKVSESKVEEVIDDQDSDDDIWKF